MKKTKFIPLMIIVLIAIISSCSSNESEKPTENINIPAVTNADAGSSYSNSKTDILVDYYSIPSGTNSGDLRDAIAYLDANNDGKTDVFMATGKYLLQGEVNSFLSLNNGSGNFTNSTSEFNNSMPPATHARKSIVCDFDGNGLKDILVFDHGYDSNPFPGSNPKLIMQKTAGSFTWSKLPEVGFFHGGAGADIDNDGDIDVFVGGFDPFFYINDGKGNFTKVTNRFDNSIDKVFTAELIDVDKDGYVDLLVGAHEQEGDKTSIYWGNNKGTYSSKLRTLLPAFNRYGTVLDFEAEDIDKDGDRDVIVNRTGGGNSNFYIGRKIQLLINGGNRQFTDATNKIDNPGTDSDAWFPWLRAQDIDNDGDIDLFPDNLNVGFKYINDGSGNFTKTL